MSKKKAKITIPDEFKYPQVEHQGTEKLMLEAGRDLYCSVPLAKQGGKRPIEFLKEVASHKFVTHWLEVFGPSSLSKEERQKQEDAFIKRYYGGPAGLKAVQRQAAKLVIDKHPIEQ